MKKTLLKIIAAFTFVLTMIISLGTIKTYAATSPYQLSTYFTFSSDMDIEEGFNLISHIFYIKMIIHVLKIIHLLQMKKMMVGITIKEHIQMVIHLVIIQE